MKKFIEDVRKNKDAPNYEEAEVEHWIVTPLLKLLNWPISKTNGIKLRYNDGSGKADYALMINDKPQVFIEAKRSAQRLEVAEEEQISRYAFHEGVGLAILTNGTEWRFYLPREKGHWKDRRFCTLDLLHDDIEYLVTRFDSLLGRDKVENGEYIKNAKAIHEVQQRERDEQQRKQIVSENLQKAWDKIINEPNISFIELLKTVTKEICTYIPNDDEIKQFLNEQKPTPPVVSIQPIRPYQEDSNNQRTQPPAFRVPILVSLMESGTRGKASNILKKVEDKMKDILKPFDYEKNASGAIRWKNTAQWERNSMRDEGLIKSVKESRRGTWELSAKGIEFARQYYKE